MENLDSLREKLLRLSFKGRDVVDKVMEESIPLSRVGGPLCPPLPLTVSDPFTFLADPATSSYILKPIMDENKYWYYLEDPESEHVTLPFYTFILEDPETYNPRIHCCFPSPESSQYHLSPLFWLLTSSLLQNFKLQLIFRTYLTHILDSMY